MKDKIWIFTLIWAAFFFKGILSPDPDFGWHIKVGEIISFSGIPKTDPFSFTMPSYPFVDHEWLTDLITFKIYPIIGSIGLSAIYALFAGFSVILVTPKNRWALIPIILSTSLLLSFVGIRPQILSWFFVAIILKITFDDTLWQNWRLLLPFIFIVWANLHGGFSVGLGIIFLIILSKAFQAKRLILSDLLIFIISLSGSLINPYGVNLWKEIWNSFSDSSLRLTVVEWHPILAHFNIIFLILLALSVFMAFKYRSYLGLKQSVLFLSLLLAGLSSLRNVPFWVLINIPVLSLCFEKFYQEVKNNKIQLRRLHIAYKTLLILIVLVSTYHVASSFKEDLEWPQDRLYPLNAISYLRQNPPKGEIFAPYSWGGYLIFKFPEKKVFVDGRMPSWRWTPPDKNESSYAYKEYQDIISKGGDFIQTFNKYNVRTVLWSVMLYLEPKKPKSFTQRLEAAGWKKIYSDDVAVIYEK